MEALQSVVEYIREKNLSNDGERRVVVIMLEPNGQTREDGAMGVNLSVGTNGADAEQIPAILRLALRETTNPSKDVTAQIQC